MNGSYFLGNQSFEVRPLPDQEPGPGCVRVRVAACGVCGTDVHIYHGGKGSADVKPPVVLGHEFSGVVEALGVLMLLLVDGREGECRQLQDFNRTVNLPTSLSDVDITVDDVRRAAPEILRDADLEHYPYQVTEDMLVRAAEKLAS